MHTDLLHLQRYNDSGNAGEFQALVQYHARMVFATACRVTRDPSLAEDVAQETFLELARKGRSITESVGAWLHRVAWRRACDAVRAESTRHRYESAALVLNEGRECTWEELEPLFDEAISELAAEERAVIVEHYLEGRKQTEIAARMGLSQSSVSRLLEQSINHLRSRLKKKGLLCGAAFGGMMATSLSQAAPVPASLMTALHKIGLSSIGSGAATATGGALLGLNFKLVVSCFTALMACAVGYDLASKDSLLARWFWPEQAMATKSNAVAPQAVARNTEDAAMSKARLLAEAKAIWARRPRLTKAEMERLLGGVVYERDPEKRLAAMRAVGITLSRPAYDRVLARHPDIHLFDERKAGHAMGKLFSDLGAAWCMESPREAIVCFSLWGDSVGDWFPATIAPWVRSHPDEWAAFVEAGPDPRLGEYAKLWVEDLNDPGSIWAKAKDAHLDLGAIQRNIFLFLSNDAPADPVLALIMRCPDAKVRSESIMGIVAKLSSEQLLQAANSGLFQDAGLVNTLRAMGGDPQASFSMASTWVTGAANGGGAEAQIARWMEESAGRFYENWLKVDAKGALQHSVRASNEILLDRFMEVAAKSPAIDEALIVEALSSPKNRDRALAAYYQVRAGGDPTVALQSIMSSSFVEDQIDSAREVLTQWSVTSAPEAAAWVLALPASEDRDELMAAVTSKWVETAPEEAIAFAQAHHLGLGHGWTNGLAWGARTLPEDKLSAMLTPLREDPEYNIMLTRLVGWRCPSRPQEAFALLSKYAAPGWQTPIVSDTIHWLENDDARAEDYALLLPTLDLDQVDAQSIAKVAQLFVQRFAGKGQLQTALDWTLKLPASMALQARSEAVARQTLGDDKQRAVAEQWIRHAAISESERTALLQQVQQDTASPAGISKR